MKVKELLELLQQATPEADVWFNMDSGCCGDFEEMEAIDAELMEVDKQNYVRINFRSLPGYRSCRQVGATKDAHKKYWKLHNPKILKKDKGEV